MFANTIKEILEDYEEKLALRKKLVEIENVLDDSFLNEKIRNIIDNS